MSTTHFIIGKNDVQPSLRIQATTVSDGNEIPLTGLTGATVLFSMRNRATGALKVNRQAATVESVPNAYLRYEWQAGDTDTPGVYDADFEVNGQMTVPNGRKITVTVTEDTD